MSVRFLARGILTTCLLVVLSWPSQPAPADAPPAGSVVDETIPCPSLAGNLLGETGRRAVSVYLPPSYARQPARRYPAVYLLHGYQGSHTQWMSGGKEWNIRDVMDGLIARGKFGEMIVVMPDARNRFGGSFYTNSVTTGNWEDFLATDLVTAIDGRFRTLARPASRGIAGHSMGGYGAVKLAMKFPDRFGAVYAHSPACLTWGGDLTPEDPAWDTTLSFRVWKDLQPNGKNYLAQAFMALAAAWSPNPDRPPFFADLPVAGKRPGRRREEVIARWSANMPVAMVDQYRSNLARLRGIAFDVGTRDQFPHIPLGTRALAAALRRNGIRYTYEEYDGDHNEHVPRRIEVKLLPFFSRTLAFEK
jgi:S-formylglutathione hydrolase FrmB